MSRIFILALLLPALFSCQESDKQRLTRLVQEWDGKEIAFPAQVVFTVQGRDTVDFRWQAAPYRIVTYVDSLGCASCKLQLPKWKQLIVETDSLFGKKKLSYVFFFHPKDARELTYLTRRDAFTYPVCFDREDAFNHLNRFPSEMALQTFLLDKDNRVVAIGNPVHNPQVKELYLNIIGGKRSATTGTKQTSASLSEQDVRFGSFPMGEKKERKVTLKNTGDAPLVIHGVDTSCGCTRVEYSQRPLRPGEETTLLIIYEADEAGHFRKTVDVYCNTADAPLRISVTGEAVSN
ncbi:DUF1573 domain-containing protein [Bacteroides gallinaceum]|uniref:DUF1573 domain-containing protein n=1 Tax=Bacteroidaceae TaxID=815 RepID=UPI0025AB4FC9|nr:DUF1573 domain-containing protein [Bacteroides gallinaceum]MDN0080579.1 DUF1573 domain-containing protein [Bacteroides gallinaceum]